MKSASLFVYFTLIVWVMPFINKSESLRNLAIFLMSLIFLFDIIHVTVLEPGAPDPNFFLWIPASTADAAAVNPIGTNTLLANNVCAFFINDRPTFVNGTMSLPMNQSDYIVLNSWIFDSSMSFDELFTRPCKDLQLVY